MYFQNISAFEEKIMGDLRESGTVAPVTLGNPDVEN
jgi:hypothetical protein